MIPKTLSVKGTQTITKLGISLCKFRTLNVKLLIKFENYNNTPMHQRYYQLCNTNIIGHACNFMLDFEALNRIKESSILTNTFTVISICTHL
jgi:hypothetical protein